MFYLRTTKRNIPGVFKKAIDTIEICIRRKKYLVNESEDIKFR